MTTLFCKPFIITGSLSFHTSRMSRKLYLLVYTLVLLINLAQGIKYTRKTSRVIKSSHRLGIKISVQAIVLMWGKPLVMLKRQLQSSFLT